MHGVQTTLLEQPAAVVSKDTSECASEWRENGRLARSRTPHNNSVADGSFGHELRPSTCGTVYTVPLPTLTFRGVTHRGGGLKIATPTSRSTELTSAFATDNLGRRGIDDGGAATTRMTSSAIQCVSYEADPSESDYCFRGQTNAGKIQSGNCPTSAYRSIDTPARPSHSLPCAFGSYGLSASADVWQGECWLPSFIPNRHDRLDYGE